MTVQVTCDWCAHPIESDQTYSAEELNRLGFEEGLGDHHIVIEARYNGTDRYGSAHGRTEIRHFHNPDCYLEALAVWDAQRRWAQSRGGGPAGAATPKWTGDKLADPPPKARPRASASAHRALGEHVVRAEGAARAKRRAKIDALIAERDKRRKAGTPFTGRLEGGLGMMLWHADVVTFEELARLTKDELLAVHKIGPTRAAEIIDAMTAHGFALREGVE